MAHRRSHSRSTTFASRSPSPMSYSFTLPPFPSPLLPITKPRKTKIHRMTFLALFALITVSTYIFFVARPTLARAPIRLRTDLNNGANPGIIVIDTDDAELPRSRLHRFPSSHYRKSQSPMERPQIQLNQSEELAAVASFLASLPQNVIPASIDPSRSIDPQLVLDFDTRGPRAADELRTIVEDVWTQNPVVLFTKLRSSMSREVKSIIADMNLSPPPTIFDVDQRDDASVLIPLLFRLTSSNDLPILLIGGKPVGTTSEIKSIFTRGDLHRMVADAGAVIGSAPAMKKRGRK